MKLANILRTASVLLTAALPLSVSAAITDFTFVNGFSSLNEVANPPANTTAAGIDTVTTFAITTLSFDDSFGSFGRLTVNISYSGLDGNSTAAHVHNGAIGVNGGVSIGSALSHPSANSGAITGTYTPADLAAKNLLFSGGNYVNLHSSVYAGGELRGQLTPIPEPSAYGIIAGAFILGVVTIRRRNVRSA
jgi:CHRD domain